MLPRNLSRRTMMQRLHIFSESVSPDTHLHTVVLDGSSCCSGSSGSTDRNSGNGSMSSSSCSAGTSSMSCSFSSGTLKVVLAVLLLCRHTLSVFGTPLKSEPQIEATFRSCSPSPSLGLTCCPLPAPPWPHHQELPDDIRANLTEVLPQPREIPRKLSEYTQEEVDAFPRLWTP